LLTDAGRRTWLRPGKKYLIGRTSAEAGQLIATHKSISRKHLTITVDSVAEGAAQDLVSRSKITLEDLQTSKGTSVNGQSIQGQKYVVSEPEVEFLMGKCPEAFRYVRMLP
jgi:pSer/pThr/pTyr-binding forkhead associated (FHA) protein